MMFTEKKKYIIAPSTFYFSVSSICKYLYLYSVERIEQRTHIATSDCRMNTYRNLLLASHHLPAPWTRIHTRPSQYTSLLNIRSFLQVDYLVGRHLDFVSSLNFHIRLSYFPLESDSHDTLVVRSF